MPKKTFEQLSQDKQNQLVEAGLKCFSNQHFSTVKISQIIAEADIPRSSFYDYFTDKKDFYHYLLKQISEAKNDHMSRFEAKTPEDIFDKIRQSFIAGASFARNHPLYNAFFNKALEEPQQLIDLYGEDFLDSSDWYESCLIEGQGKGQISQSMDVSFMARSISFLAADWLSDLSQNQMPLEELADQLIDFIKNGIKAPQ